MATRRRLLTRRRLDAEMVRRKLVASRTEAKRAIEEGRVGVGGVPEPKPATQVTAETSIRMTEPPSPYVGRGALKLVAALDAFGIDVTGRRALDVGASTGGFTDVLLQRGAAQVVAVDVGYGQLDYRLRTDPRVVVKERTNIRTVPVDELGAPFDIVVADLSFISLRTVAPQLVAAVRPEGDIVVLVKPQFEVGKGRVGRGGIVRDPELHVEAIESVAAAFEDLGFGLTDAVPSPITGAKGNREYLARFRRGPRRLSHADIEELVAR